MYVRGEHGRLVLGDESVGVRDLHEAAVWQQLGEPAAIILSSPAHAIFFPGGKEQLGAETIRFSGQLYIQLFATIAMQAPDVLSAVGDFFAGAAETLEETDYADACPIATVALEVASTSEPMREATAEVFDTWITGATEYFAAAGIPRHTARELAFTMLSLLEGAFIFCRAMRTTEPLQIAGASAVAAVQAALPRSA